MTTDGFMAQYRLFLTEFANERRQCLKAYEATERKYCRAFGQNKYKSYEIFTVMLSKKHKQRRKKNALERVAAALKIKR